MMVSPTSMPSAANLVEELVEELGAELKQSQSPSPEAEPPTELPASARASVQPALPADTSAANVEQVRPAVQPDAACERCCFLLLLAELPLSVRRPMSSCGFSRHGERLGESQRTR